MRLYSLNNTVKHYEAGTTLWSIPIRYWEKTEPNRVVVVEDNGENGFYVYADEYGHNVYMDRDDVYFQKEAAQETAELLARMYEIRHSDDTNYVCDGIFKKIDAEREARKTEGTA